MNVPIAVFFFALISACLKGDLQSGSWWPEKSQVVIAGVREINTYETASSPRVAASPTAYLAPE